MDKPQVFQAIQRARPLADANNVSSIPFSILGAYLSGATVGASSYTFGVKFRDAQYDAARWNLVLPSGWAGKGLNVRFAWGTPNSNTGNVMWAIEILKIEEGIAHPSTYLDNPNVVSAAPGATHTPVLCQLSTSLAGWEDGDSMGLQLLRYGPNASDTYTSDAWVYSAIISVG